MLNLKNTLDGYLKNVEVIGNTVQDTNNLANIRSVGDKVEGQELYKIDVVSCGKNLFDGVSAKGRLATAGKFSIINSDKAGYCTLKPIRIHPNNSYKVSNAEWVVLYDKDLNVIRYVSAHSSFTTAYNEVYCGFYSIYDTYNLSNSQLELNTQATSYEPYQEQKLELLSPVQLEKVGDVADRIICKDGVWGVEKNINNIYPTFTHNIDHLGFKFYKSTLEDIIDTSVPTKIYFLSNHNVVSFDDRFNNIKEGDVYISMSKWVYVASKLSGEEFNGIYNGKVLVKYPTLKPQFIPLPHDQQVKLRTFAGQTNIAFLTEIAGQIKAQVPKSLGATVNAHTEQIADLHNSLERVKKLEETTVSTIETGSSFTTVNETSNGYFEDVKLEGKTLVNLNKYLENNKVLNIKGNGHYNDISICDLSQIKLNTTYTMLLDIEMLENNSSWELGVNTRIAFGQSDVKNTLISHPRQMTIANNGGAIHENYSGKVYQNNVITFNIKELNASGSNYLSIRPIMNTQLGQGESIRYKVKNLIILEGDHTNNPPEYFEGLMSVGQDVEEVSVASCDFIDITEFELGGFNGEGYPVENGARVRTSNYIPYANTKLKLGMLGSQEAEIVFYNKDKTKLSNIAWVKDGDIVAVPNNTQYVKVALRYPNDVVIYPSDIKYFKMSCPKDKKPLLYYNPTTEMWEKPVLREWDTIEKHSDGKYYYHKRSGEVVLNGNESWNQPTWSKSEDWLSRNPNGFAYETYISITGKSCDTPVICNKFNSKSIPNSSSLSIGYCTLAGNYLSFATTVQSTVEQWKSELQTNNVTVVYQLKQEEVYECTNIDLMTYSGETNYIINSGAISPKSLLKVHNNISNVVKILQEKVSLLENTFIAGLKSVLSGDMYSLATILYPEDFEQNDNTEQDIMVIPE